MGNGKHVWLTVATLVAVLQVTQQQTVDECSGPIRAEYCAPIIEVEIVECNYGGKYCYIFDALEPLCMDHEAYFDSPTAGGHRAEGPPVCTTTTTATHTATHTTTRTGTFFSTTRGQAIECRDFCYENSHPWIVKCGWPACASCGECASILLPSTAPETTSAPDQSFTPRPVRGNTTTRRPSTSAATGQQSGGSGGGSAPVFESDGSLEEAANGPTTEGLATTTMQLESKACLKLCYDAKKFYNWPKLCTWATCVLCPECSGTSVTMTTTTIPFTLTLTHTSTKVIATGPPTSSTTATETRTSTTTSTVTDTSTITSTTTDRACAPASPILTSIMADEDCKGNLSAGDVCVAAVADHPCLYPGDLVLQCPRNNILYREPELLSGIFRTKCRICGFGHTDWEDTDPTGGRIAVSLEFGANAILGAVDESDIFGYGIFLADNCSRPLQRDEVGYVPKMDPYPYDDRCCTMNAYQTSISFDVPPGYTSVILSVRVNTSFGFLPLGEVTSEIMDWNETRATISGAARFTFPGYLLAFVGILLFGGFTV
ncbi:unnamed protein product [Effrenium voratum]|uniref:Uncharacterized protein n=1 Tax=Effrenium voratum TaxID=2562239 RepID=A0AA36JEX6_9DINO|nr:unnamed protein product [Effrenium voratum]CAJ1404943.1 unnamed protein product [Effrenium voratum]|mmetsp:Transcript_122863/g.292254  ORF Transcript_122863/g.292254 Transcript_122863/m.292254 type:complete len:544 (-) Transcript_122863:260-1891(-)|eukprot:CAMPEP_0181412678 /NCGR_PEP_ID=MMETSP1110-20121109/8556_1 /TAXON_ID=174948 /ORGANISM="Symbiodinium sp., Strain CCMP421" /LENGTH=543 /DNA_ID=CAMNT_0023535419 /DNA_START=26 /DNA_END=1657 /DNA_ORIENTATION=-